MFILRRGIILYRNAVSHSNLPLQSKKLFRVSVRTFSTEEADNRKMLDPKHIAKYEDVLKLINNPKTVLIDVRNEDEVQTTGMIPSSINIPLPQVKDALEASNEHFMKTYNREKPLPTDQVVFYCRTGRRSTEALNKALELGYTNSKTYLGSWTEWSSKVKE